jgi:toxin ParE1/3/4
MFTQPAEYDLIDIEHYIYVELENPLAAEHIIDGIIVSAEQLAYYPQKHQYVNDSLLRNIGIRRTSYENYNIFYYYNTTKDVVYIVRILYEKADWKNILQP